MSTTPPRTAAAPASPTEMLDAFTHYIAAADELHRIVGAPKRATLRAWIPENLTVLRSLLRTRTREPELILPLVNAIVTLQKVPEFDTDPIAWFAANSGLSLKTANQIRKTSDWLYNPSAITLPAGLEEQTAAKRNAAARKMQADLRALIWEYRVPLDGIMILRAETYFLCASAKPQTQNIITQALTTTGQYPAVTTLQRTVRRLVNKANREHRALTPGMEHTHITFSRPDGNGMVLFQGRCTAEQATLFRDGIARSIKTVSPQESNNLSRHAQDFQAFFNVFVHGIHALTAGRGGTKANDKPLLPRMTIDDTAPTADVNYSVGVVLTSQQLRDLQENPNLNPLLRTSENGKVPWAQIRASKLSPFDWIAIIDKTGIRIKHDTDKNARFASKHQRFLASLRAPYCAHPGCDVPASRCQAHHVLAFKDGGETVQSNLVLVCERHHANNDDTHSKPGQYHYELDEYLIPYKQAHPKDGEPKPPPEYNQYNLVHSPALIAMRQ